MGALMGEVGVVQTAVVRTVIVLVGFGIGFAIADIVAIDAEMRPPYGVWDDNGGDSGNVVDIDAPTFVTSPPEERVIVKAPADGRLSVMHQTLLRSGKLVSLCVLADGVALDCVDLHQYP